MDTRDLYFKQKHTDSAFALLQAASLPYESFSERSGAVVPGVFPGPESQLTDLITDAAGIDPDLHGYAEVTCEPTFPLAMTSVAAMPATADDAFGVFTYQSSLQGTSCVSGALQTATRRRSIMVVDNAIPYLVTSAMTGTVRFIRRRLVPHPILNVGMEYTTGGGVWIAAAVAVLMDDIIANLTFTLPLGAVAIRMLVTVVNPTATQFILDIAVQPDSGSFRFPYAWSTLTLHSWPYLTSLPPTQMMRRICLDAMFTWEGPDLQNGGKIAAALVPSQFSPQAVYPYNAVANLRSDRMDGPVKHGAHVTWRPGALEEIDRFAVDNWNPSTLKLVFGYNFTDNLGDARIRVFGMFGFTSTNPIIGRMVWTPAITPAMIEALGLYWEQYPAATANANHVVLKALKAGGKAGAKALRHLLEQDDRLAALALSMGQPEVAAAIKTVGKVNRMVPKQPLKKLQSGKAKPAGARPVPPPKPRNLA